MIFNCNRRFHRISFMSKKKYNPYNSDLFNKTNLNGESTPETVHLKGTGVEKTDADTQDSVSYRQEADISKKQLADSERMTSDVEESEKFPKGSVSEKVDTESRPEIPIEVQRNHDDIREVTYLAPSGLFYFARNGYEGVKRFFMGQYDERDIEPASDPYNKVTSLESKSMIPEESFHKRELKTQSPKKESDVFLTRKSTTKRSDRRYDADFWRRDDFERKQKEREEKERQDFERRQKERAERERREFERQERERQERERRERERQERERKERERQEKELQKKRNVEHDVLYFSEIIPSISEDCYIALYTEKKDGLGEDSMPLIYRSSNTQCVGVFDGMGGAGATEYPTLTIGSKTGAYLSSRIVRAVCYDWLDKNGMIDVWGLKEEISKYFNFLLSIWNVKPSGLRSGFVRVLPTTLAIVEATRNRSRIDVSSYWAGDSRNYVLLASGLKQLSCDDLRQPKDPLENLRSDDALSNCICQDKPFEINVKRISFNEPIIIISATDGCFGYLLTPMHFEFILLDCMMKSSNCTEWRESIRKTLSPISSDDFTIGLQIVDGDFNYWQNLLHGRYEFLKESVIEPIEQMRSAYENARQECALWEQNLYNGITEQWHQYKEEFLLTNQSYHHDN